MDFFPNWDFLPILSMYHQERNSEVGMGEGGALRSVLCGNKPKSTGAQRTGERGPNPLYSTVHMLVSTFIYESCPSFRDICTGRQRSNYNRRSNQVHGQQCTNL